MSTEKITPADIEAKFRELSTEVDETGDQVKTYAIAGAVVVGLLVCAVVFTVGRRRGKKKSTVVEIRRI